MQAETDFKLNDDLYEGYKKRLAMQQLILRLKPLDLIIQIESDRISPEYESKQQGIAA
jgi:hypothetical protein